MKSVIYDYYGVYPDSLDDLKFTYLDKTYYIFFTDKTEEELKMLAQINQQVAALFKGRSATLIVNRDKKFLTPFQGYNLVLLTLKATRITLKDVWLMQTEMLKLGQDQRFKIGAILSLWEARFNYIEQQAVPTLRADLPEYNRLLEAVFFAYGLAENALNYLADLKADVGEFEVSPTLNHLRFFDLDCLVFFNPLNFYFDHSCRDLADLYRAGVIDLGQLENLLDVYQYQMRDAALFLARILYPAPLFDLLEDLHLQKSDIRQAVLEYHRLMPDTLMRLKKAHQLLVRKYQIRPINWLVQP